MSRMAVPAKAAMVLRMLVPRLLLTCRGRDGGEAGGGERWRWEGEEGQERERGRGGEEEEGRYPGQDGVNLHTAILTSRLFHR